MVWVLTGWVVVAVLVAGLHHRMQVRTREALGLAGASPRPENVTDGTDAPRVEAFVSDLKDVLLTRPGVAFCGMVPGRFAAVIEVEGQETPVPLQEVFRHAEAFPEAFEQIVDRLIDEITEMGLDEHVDFALAEVALDLMPQVRSEAFVQAQGRFGDGGLVARPLAEGLMTCYVVDDSRTMVFVCRQDLANWGLDVDELHRLSLRNLERRVRSSGSVADGPGLAGRPPAADEILPGVILPRRAHDDRVVVLNTEDGYDAARLLLLDPRRCEDLLMAVPDRDFLWIGSRTIASTAVEPGTVQDRNAAIGTAIPRDLEALEEAVAELFATAAHPVSDQIWNLSPTGLRAVHSAAAVVP